MNVRVFGQSEFALRGGASGSELQLREHEVLMHASAYKALFERRFIRDDRARPWKRGIVKLRGPGGSESVRLLYRSAPAKGLGSEVAVVHDRTLDRLTALVGGALSSDARDDSSTIGFALVATGEPQLSGRFLFYWDHPDDQARAAFKLGTIGLALGVLALPGTIELLITLATKALR
jgi:hypothetical protein